MRGGRQTAVALAQFRSLDARAPQDPIPNAWGQYGVSAIYVDVDAEDKSEEPRKLVCMDTAMCETALSVTGARELIERLYAAVSEIEHGDEAKAHADALAAGEHFLEDVRDELGPSAFNSLRRGKVLTIEQVQRLSDAELLAIPNLGAVRLARVREVCGQAPAMPKCPVCGAETVEGRSQSIARHPAGMLPLRVEPGVVAYRCANGHYHDGEQETGPVPEDIVIREGL